MRLDSDFRGNFSPSESVNRTVEIQPYRSSGPSISQYKVVSFERSNSPSDRGLLQSPLWLSGTSIVLYAVQIAHNALLPSKTQEPCRIGSVSGEQGRPLFIDAFGDNDAYSLDDPQELPRLALSRAERYLGSGRFVSVCRRRAIHRSISLFLRSGSRCEAVSSGTGQSASAIQPYSVMIHFSSWAQRIHIMTQLLRLERCFSCNDPG